MGGGAGLGGRRRRGCSDIYAHALKDDGKDTSVHALGRIMSTRRASDGNRTAARASDDADFRQTVHTAPDNGHEHSSEEQHTPGPVAPQVSEKEVARLEADNDRMHRSNEVKNMVFEAIYAQLPEKIQGEMSECGVGWQKKDSGFKFSDLSEAELKRLTKWLLEQKPFAELKEFELEGMYS